MERVFARAREHLGEAAARPAARERQVERVLQALRFVPTGDAVIECSPDAAAALAGRLPATDGLSVEAREEFPAGFRITGAGGALTVDATLECLLELERPVLAILVLRSLEADTP